MYLKKVRFWLDWNLICVLLLALCLRAFAVSYRCCFLLPDDFLNVEMTCFGGQEDLRGLVVRFIELGWLMKILQEMAGMVCRFMEPEHAS